MELQSSVEVCIRERYPELVRAVSAVTKSVPAAEDAVAEAFARAWERERKGQAFDHLAGWVVTVALNLARSRWRKVGRERPLPERSETAARAAESELSLDVRAAVAELPRRQREAVVLHYLMDLDVATTASLLGVAEGTVKAALHRARQTLAPRLAPQEV